ncbi:hypothetical protein ABIF73_009326 [Bradyrhizobium japonicum]
MRSISATLVNRREALAAIAFVWFAASKSVDQQELQVRFACELQGVCTILPDCFGRSVLFKMETSIAT